MLFSSGYYYPLIKRKSYVRIYMQFSSRYFYPFGKIFSYYLNFSVFESGILSSGLRLIVIRQHNNLLKVIIHFNKYTTLRDQKNIPINNTVEFELVIKYITNTSNLQPETTYYSKYWRMSENEYKHNKKKKDTLICI